jgi:serine/threonine protein kinase
MALDHHIDALPAGTRLGSYEMLRVLGRGGFGVTYAARVSGQSGQMVAIKEWFPRGLCCRRSNGNVEPVPGADQESIRDALAMFSREAEVICSIRHPHLVRGIECLQKNRTAYLVMAYVSGRNLQESLREKQGSFRVTPSTIAQLCHGMLSALESVHRHGIVHADIKPDNIFLGVGFQPILIDLGSACVPAGATKSSERTYSMHYSAIEQVSTRYGHLGPWTDIYQFSAVLYRCLTGGKLPDAMVRAEAKADPIVPLIELRSSLPHYPEEFLRAIDAGLARFPKDRPQSLQSWRRLLDPALRRMDHNSHGPGHAREPVLVSVVHPPAHDSGRAKAIPPPLPVPQQATADSQPVKDPLKAAGLLLVAVIFLLGASMLIQKCSA